MRPSSQLNTLSAGSDVAQDDNWMLSYIDVFVLITTLFLMLLVMNKAGFGDSPVEGLEGEVHALPVSSNQQQDKAAHHTQTLEHALLEDQVALNGLELLSGAQLYSELEESISRHHLAPHIELVKEKNRTRIEIQSRVLFDSGDAYLTRAGEAVLEKVLPVLQEVNGSVIIEGHTDDQPINTPRFPSNWNLAAARAAEVLEFFVSEGLSDQRFRAVSFGDTRPLHPNTSEQNRRKNRRVSLIIEKAGTIQAIELP